MAATDPGAIYNQTLGDLKLQAGNELGTIGEQEGFLKSNLGTINPATGQAEGGIAGNELTRQEPITYTAEANRANKGGILNSGINTQRKTTIANSFSAKRIANTAKLTQGLAGYNKQRETVGLKETEGEHKAAQSKAEQEDALQAQFPTVPVTGTTPTAPTAPVQPGAPGNLGKWVNVPGGSVRINNAQGPRVIGQKKQPTTRG